MPETPIAVAPMKAVQISTGSLVSHKRKNGNAQRPTAEGPKADRNVGGYHHQQIRRAWQDTGGAEDIALAWWVLVERVQSRARSPPLEVGMRSTLSEACSSFPARLNGILSA